MKFSAIIAIAVVAVIASLAIVDAAPVLNRRASQPNPGRAIPPSGPNPIESR
jgi:hypothetical protein